MSIAKTALITLGLVFSLTTLANAAPPSHTAPVGKASYPNDVAGKTQQDRFVVNY